MNVGCRGKDNSLGCEHTNTAIVTLLKGSLWFYWFKITIMTTGLSQHGQ